jgi:formylglycine-generating enzyme required for sulfatase activity
MYALCVEAGVCEKPYFDNYSNPDYQDHPVVGVDWYQAQAYCGWAGWWLPTAAEWEKAARGTDGRIYPWREGIDCKLANYWGRDGGCIGDTQPVGSYPGGASPYGELDLAGNASEWVADWFDGNDYTYSPGENPLGTGSGQLYPSEELNVRMRLGGSWRSDQDSTRAAYRGSPSSPTN